MIPLGIKVKSLRLAGCIGILFRWIICGREEVRYSPLQRCSISLADAGPFTGGAALFFVEHHLGLRSVHYLPGFVRSDRHDWHGRQAQLVTF